MKGYVDLEKRWGCDFQHSIRASPCSVSNRLQKLKLIMECRETLSDAEEGLKELAIEWICPRIRPDSKKCPQYLPNLFCAQLQKIWIREARNHSKLQKLQTCACLSCCHKCNFLCRKGVRGHDPFQELLRRELVAVEVRTKICRFYCFHKMNKQCLVQFGHGIRRDCLSRNLLNECRIWNEMKTKKKYNWKKRGEKKIVV